jgi:hypothetical protein
MIERQSVRMGHETSDGMTRLALDDLIVVVFASGATPTLLPCGHQLLTAHGANSRCRVSKGCGDRVRLTSPVETPHVACSPGAGAMEAEAADSDHIAVACQG